MAPQVLSLRRTITPVKRRGFVISVSLVATGMLPTRSSFAGDQVKVRIRLDQSALDAIPVPLRVNLDIHKDRSTEADAMIKATPAERAVPVILIVIGVLAVSVLFRTVQEMIRQGYYGGVLIDMRKSPIEVTSSRTIPANMVFVIDLSGATKQYKSDDFVETTLASLLSNFRPK